MAIAKMDKTGITPKEGVLQGSSVVVSDVLPIGSRQKLQKASLMVGSSSPQFSHFDIRYYSSQITATITEPERLI
jgi:hypothetical protein